MKRTHLQHAIEDVSRALVYMEAARRILGPTGDFLTDFPMLAPTSFLVAHAIELSLSSYLRASGKNGGRSNHDLKSRLAAAEEIGFSPSLIFRKCIIAIDASHTGNQFRYSKDIQEPFISPRDIITYALPDIEAIERYVVQKVMNLEHRA